MAICRAMAAISVEVCVDMLSWSQERWDCDVNSFTETDFIQNVKMSGATFNLSALLNKTLRAKTFS